MENNNLPHDHFIVQIHADGQDEPEYTKTGIYLIRIIYENIDAYHKARGVAVAVLCVYVTLLLRYTTR